jgi:hypothetical protein
VIAVPMDAVRGVREMPAIAHALGLNPDSVRAQLEPNAARENGGGGGER